MSDLLAIIDEHATDDTLLAEIGHGHYGRVTVLLELEEESDWAADESARGWALRDRLAGLLTAVERRTGAVVEGLAGTRALIEGLSYDSVLEGRPLIAA